MFIILRKKEIEKRGLIYENIASIFSRKSI